MTKSSFATSECFCNNDCTKYFSPTLQHTTGVCDTSLASPRCGMGPCLTEVVGGTTFEWVDVDGLAADGCECRRVQGNLTVDLPDRAASATGGASWVDENCDGVDGVQADAIFVSATGPVMGNGSRTAPFRTITQGIAALAPQNKRYVLVAQGLYRENVRLAEGQQLFGGYSGDFLKRDPLLFVTFIQGVQPSGTELGAVNVESAGSGGVDTVIAGFTIVGWDAPPAAVNVAGEASIAVHLFNVGPRVVISSNEIIAGRGGQGGNGSTGDQGFGRQASQLLNGQRGVDSQHFPMGSCSAAANRTGGAGGGVPGPDAPALPGGGRNDAGRAGHTLPGGNASTHPWVARTRRFRIGSRCPP